MSYFNKAKDSERKVDIVDLKLGLDNLDTGFAAIVLQRQKLESQIGTLSNGATYGELRKKMTTLDAEENRMKAKIDSINVDIADPDYAKLPVSFKETKAKQLKELEAGLKEISIQRRAVMHEKADAEMDRVDNADKNEKVKAQACRYGNAMLYRGVIRSMIARAKKVIDENREAVLVECAEKVAEIKARTDISDVEKGKQITELPLRVLCPNIGVAIIDGLDKVLAEEEEHEKAAALEVGVVA